MQKWKRFLVCGCRDSRRSINSEYSENNDINNNNSASFQHYSLDIPSQLYNSGVLEYLDADYEHNISVINLETLNNDDNSLIHEEPIIVNPLIAESPKKVTFNESVSVTEYYSCESSLTTNSYEEDEAEPLLCRGYIGYLPKPRRVELIWYSPPNTINNSEIEEIDQTVKSTPPKKPPRALKNLSRIYPVYEEIEIDKMQKEKISKETIYVEVGSFRRPEKNNSGIDEEKRKSTPLKKPHRASKNRSHHHIYSVCEEIKIEEKKIAEEPIFAELIHIPSPGNVEEIISAFEETLCSSQEVRNDVKSQYKNLQNSIVHQIKKEFETAYYSGDYSKFELKKRNDDKTEDFAIKKFKI